MINLGDTFLMPSPNDVPEHLWIVITQPNDENMAACVNVTDEMGQLDKTTILEKGEHTFITKRSVIRFQSGKMCNMTLVEKAIKEGISGKVCKLHDPCSKEMLKKVQEGAKESKFSPNWLKGLFP